MSVFSPVWTVPLAQSSVDRCVARSHGATLGGQQGAPVLLWGIVESRCHGIVAWHDLQVYSTPSRRLVLLSVSCLTWASSTPVLIFINPLTPTVATWVRLQSFVHQTGLSGHLQFLTSGHSDALLSECPDVKNYKWRLNPVWHMMLQLYPYGNSGRQRVSIYSSRDSNIEAVRISLMFI